ncbi:hypothetical protein M3649_21235 [Ureibacillus chungkukjangi]|uniref:hypothetical protein n=1 Tax=Ureibacillus chungkukjangi TaxID=1202712 RepID=UPI00203AA4C4|nr:hypothetical protein [Ureibacillus chungkukjangi]MCM3390611.1 hypothetical protein [Ureibacillus chungkukjangi]
MENEELLKKIKNKGIDPDNLTSDDIETLIEMNIKGEFEKEVFKDYLKENNITYKIFFEGLGTFVDTHKSSSNKYLELLDYRMKDLIKQAENAKTDEQKEKLDKQIDSILDRLKEEVTANRSHGQNFAWMAGGVAIVLAGSAIFLATRNPEVFKKGVEMIAQETVKQIG